VPQVSKADPPWSRGSCLPYTSLSPCHLVGQSCSGARLCPSGRERDASVPEHAAPVVVDINAAFYSFAEAR
jgi:hypothetical protein